ncbi:xanthine dehydrogenase family protein subunit M [Starkeya sp. ORNL1]|uniref:FAD binding domain-containing protein n=1 Tax=Starkeya sp. ORNL1 TaxID=2709380 RepID=UPI001464781A|nr:xanthine dehydrogenase family protein subunit M [Starkeya sp. ORNL1]QJP12512.1 xanthine dehydrogenase family protein subunit M [Starkeya sp. ORNL1]
MIPGPFTFHRPSSLTDAVTLLAALGDDARPLAGGHSLIPMMKLRMAAPEHLIDLAGIAELKGVREDGDAIVIGAGVTQAEMVRSELLATKLPVIRETSLLIADPQVRYMGTLGGNVANGDPGNDMPALMMALDAAYVLEGVAGERRIAARDFYNGAYDTALGPGEILASVRIPIPPAGQGAAYEKLKRKIGDYATAAAAVVLTLKGDAVAGCAIALTNVADRPLFAEDASAAAIGATLDTATVKRVAELAKAITDPAADGRGPADYRREMAGVMVARALLKAASRAKGA